MITVYSYAACGTCKKALRWLEERGVEFQTVPIVDRPPSQKVLRNILRATDLPVNRLFNTSGQVYRQGGYKEKLQKMTEAEALRELSTQGKLIKRPLVLGTTESGADVHLVGFKADDYAAAFD